MKKILTGVIAILIIGAGWLLLNSNTVSYATTIDDEVSLLETELAALEVAVAAGTVTPETALMAKASIVVRMDTINTAVNAAQSTPLTAAQRTQLLNGLARLRLALGTYATTLASIDAVADQADAATKARHKSGNRPIAAVIAETIAAVEAQADEVIPDYVLEVASEIISDTDSAAAEVADSNITEVTAVEGNEIKFETTTEMETEAEVSTESDDDTVTPEVDDTATSSTDEATTTTATDDLESR